MKVDFRFLMLGLVIVASPLMAHASCEDGQAMAEDAAVTVAGKRSQGCVALSNRSSVVQNRDGSETWTVAVSCSSFIGNVIYKVQLEELEDAICRVARVTMDSNLQE